MGTAREVVANLLVDASQAKSELDSMAANADASADELRAAMERAQGGVDNVTEALRKLGTTRATPTIDLNSDPVQRKIDTLKARLDQLNSGDYRARVGLEDAAANAEVDRLQARLDHLRGEDVHPEVHVDTGDSNEKLDLLKAKMDSAKDGTSGLIAAGAALGPALIPATAAVTAGVGAMLPVLAAAGLGFGALGIFALPAISQIKTDLTKLQPDLTAFEAAQPGPAQGLAWAALEQKINLLPPAMRPVAQGVVDLKLEINDLSKSIQPQLFGAFTTWLNDAKELLPQLLPLAREAALALNDLGVSVGKGLGSPAWHQFLDVITPQIRPAIDAIGRSFGELVKGIGGLIEAFVPFAGTFESGLVRVTTAFANWSNQLGGSSGFHTFIEYVKTNGPQLLQTLKSIGDLAAQLVHDLSGFGGVDLRALTILAQALNTIAGIPTIGPIVVQIGLLALALNKIGLLSGAVTVIEGVGKAVMVLAAGGGMEGLAAAFPEIAAGLGGIAAAAPVIGLLVLFAAEVAGVIYWATHWAAVNRDLKNTFDSLPAPIRILAQVLIVPLAIIQNWGVITRTAGDVFKAFGQIIGGVTSTVETVVVGAWNLISGVTTTVWNAISGFLGRWWHALILIVSLPIGIIVDLITTNWNFIQGVTVGVWNAITGFVVHTWNTIYSTAVAVWNAISGAIGTAVNFVWHGVIEPAWNTIDSITRSIWNGISGFFTGTWSTIKSIFSGPIDWIWHTLLEPAWKAMSDGIHAVWDPIAGMFTGVWDDIKTAFSVGIDALGTVLNPFIDVADKALSLLGIPVSIPDLPHLAAGGTVGLEVVPMLAGGGNIGAGFMTNGPQAIVGEGRSQFPEFVIPTDPQHAGNANKLYSALGMKLGKDDCGGACGMAAGGTLSSGQVAAYARAGVPLAGFGLHSLAPSNIGHDIASGAGALWSGAKSVGGAIVGGLEDVAGAALGVIRGDAAAILTGLAHGIGWPWPVSNDALGILPSFADKGVQGMIDFVSGQQKAKRATSGAGSGGTGPAPSGQCGDWINQGLALAGPSAKMSASCLMARAMNESGCNPGASGAGNGDINARNGNPSMGLMQFIPSTFAANSVAGCTDFMNPVCQVAASAHCDPGNCGHGGYGCASGGVLGILPPIRSYDTGGMLPPGLSLAHNGTGRPEPVGGGHVHIEQHFHDSNIDADDAQREALWTFQRRAPGLLATAA